MYAFDFTNVLGAAYSIRAALPHFKERNAGHFLLTSSVAGRTAAFGSVYEFSDEVSPIVLGGPSAPVLSASRPTCARTVDTFRTTTSYA